MHKRRLADIIMINDYRQCLIFHLLHCAYERMKKSVTCVGSVLAEKHTLLIISQLKDS